MKLSITNSASMSVSPWWSVPFDFSLFCFRPEYLMYKFDCGSDPNRAEHRAGFTAEILPGFLFPGTGLNRRDSELTALGIRRPTMSNREARSETSVIEMPLTLDQAVSIVNAAIHRARELGANVSVAVCDRQGHLVALHRMDNAVAMANEGSIGKALASASTGLPSAQPVTGSVKESSIDLIVGMGLPVIFARGGLSITQNGSALGACGVAGASSNDQDEECARAGIDTLRT